MSRFRCSVVSRSCPELSRSLRSDKNEPCELICSWFVVVEVEGLVEAGLNIISDDGLKLEPEGLNGVGGWSLGGRNYLH